MNTKKAGRDVLTEEEKSHVRSVRLTNARYEKFRRLGGAKWLGMEHNPYPSGGQRAYEWERGRFDAVMWDADLG